MHFFWNKNTCRISWSNNNNKRDGLFVWELAYVHLNVNVKFTTPCEVKSVNASIFLSLSFSVIYLFPSCVREETLSQVNSLKVMMTFQRKQSPYASTWILEKQTTNVMHDCTWQADMVGKFSCVVCSFWNYANLRRISRREGQTLFVIEPLGERASKNAAQHRTRQMLNKWKFVYFWEVYK